MMTRPHTRTFAALRAALLGLALSAAPTLQAATPGGSASLQRASACHSSECSSLWASLQQAFRADFTLAERDGAAVMQPGPFARRYTMSPAAIAVGNWPEGTDTRRMLLFGHRTAAGLQADALAVVDADTLAHLITGNSQRVTLTLGNPPGSHENALAASADTLAASGTATPAGIAELQKLIDQPKAVFALLAIAPNGTPLRVAFVPDAIQLGASGTPDAHPAATRPADATPALQPGDEIVSQQPGQTVILHHDAEGKPASVTFQIDPSMAPTSSTPPDTSAHPQDAPRPAQTP